MHFGVLGSLGVWTGDGRPVRVPELKVRTLLASLLAHQGQPVSADRLIDDLWGTKPPSNPVGLLQNKVWQLRRALESAEPGSRDLVVSLSPGYQLRTGEGAVDADRFRDLMTRARTADDPRARATMLADALAIWRGPAFADFADEEFTRAARDRLEEQRLTALEEQAEARLSLGEHALVADELGDLVALHPLRERLRAAHVRALYLAGRQSAALSSYADLRGRLAENLGLDPGPELAALHQAILTQDAALTAVPAPDTAAAPPPTNVPTSLTGLIGRAGAIGELRALLRSNRLVTLIGSGGVGKTQLALATAAQVGAEFPGGVQLAEFGALDPSPAGEVRGDVRGQDAATSRVGVHEVLSAVLRVRDDTAPAPGSGGAPSLTDRVAQALGPRSALLVFDNCEHVVGPVAELAERLLKAAPALTILATSQVPLGITGEHLQEVPPLRRPGPAAELSPASVRHYSAVELFVARATAAAPHFVLDEDNVEAVVSICRRLDGIPLALEMAATRVRVLGVRELATRLDDRFRLLAVGARSAPARQRTLRAVIDWSWELLGDQERVVLRRLAVHADGCTLDAAEEICAADDLDRSQVLDVVARLVDWSLVVMTDGPDGPRYQLLESVTAYCVERLVDSGESDGIRRGHRDYYTALAERAEPHLRGHGQRQWLRRLDAEAANLRTAFDYAVQLGDADRALRLTNALSWYWYLRGRSNEAKRSLTVALSLGGATPAATARATALLGGFKLVLGGVADPVAEYRTALRPYEELDDPGGRARAQWFVASSLYGIGDVTPGEELVRQALTTFRSLGDRWGMAAALGSRTFHANQRGDLGALRRDGEQSLELFRELGDQWGQLQASVPLGTLAEITGDYQRAGRLYREGLRMAEDLGLWPQMSFHLSGLGRVALLTGDLPRAQEFHERSARLAARQSDGFGEQFAEIGLALGARRSGDLDAAERHLLRVIDLHRRMGYEPARPPLILVELGFLAEARGDAEAALALQLDAHAAARDTGNPRAIALTLEGLAGARSLAGHPEHAARLLGAATAARESVRAPLRGGERFDLDRIAARVGHALGGARYDAEFARGGALAPEDHLRDPLT
ncbi:BTAD domain-containing putative transcriptional regulator [Streptomyces yaizuensis]|uniref:Winged helix-turn-helix domain-containing protein n=1 Tax=Streptomyces yaizuensis TaxID=2989713 RepID=A0ABQ5P8N2_9ACTN|nr:BTAD domain-containing putative transcriptional regulator [Streptomyces sp. YSPA8]GLF98825.1 winged helix-turn-helix domain-containing protein [Streptomyces sp. YSPA8]